MACSSRKGADELMTQRHYFARGNTAEGLYNLTASVYEGLNTIYILDGYPGGTSRVLAALERQLCSQPLSIDWIHQPLDSTQLEGIIIHERGIGIIDAEAWDEAATAEATGEITETEETEETVAATQVIRVSVAHALREEALTREEAALAHLEQELSHTYEQAYACFQRTLRIHDEWEAYYIEALDRGVMNELAVQWADTHLGNRTEAATKEPRAGHRFLGAATCSGAVDFVPNLTETVQTRVFVKGRPGSGKSTLFKKLAAAATERGLDVEVYHCGFDPGSLDMLIFPERSLAIFDSTSPHEHFPVREGDRILDVYELAIAPGTDERHSEAIADVSGRYKASMKEAINLLAEAKALRNQIEAIYMQAEDEAVLEETARELLGKLQTASSSKD